MAHKEKRVDVRVYLTPDEHEYLKAVAQENSMSLSELLRTCTLRKCKFHLTKKVSSKLSLPSKAENTEKTPLPFGGDIAKIQNRIIEIDDMFRKAKKGEIPKSHLQSITD